MSPRNASSGRTRWLAGACVAWLCAASSCGSGSDAAPEWPPQAEVDAFHRALCQSAFDCCIALRGGEDGNVEACVLNLSPRSRGYHPVAGAACLDALAAAAAGTCWAVGFGPDEPCGQIWNGRHGTSGAGDPCLDDSDCVLPAGGTSRCGASDTCQWQFPGTVGDSPCVGDSVTRLGLTLFYGDGSIPRGFLCADVDGVHCDTASYTCIPTFVDGSACEAGKECASSYCSGGACEPLVEVGGSCNATRCDAAGYCDTGPLLCAPRGSTGAPCSSNQECLNGVCDADACSAMVNTTRLVLELVCLTGGV